MAVPPLVLLPPQRAALVDAGGKATNEWYLALRRLLENLEQSGVDPAVIVEIQARLDELEETKLGNFQIFGLLSVEVQGTPANGAVVLQLLNDVEAPGNTYYYGTGPTGTKGWQTVRSTLDFGDGIDLTTGSDGVTEISFNADTAEVAHLPGATYSTVQKLIDVMFSPGIITGGEVTELTTTSVRITAGTAVVRIADDNVSELRFFDFAQQDFSVPDVQVTHFYALDYNGGSPVIVESTVTENWDRDTEIPLGSALRGDGILNITPNPYRVGDVITNLIQRLDAIGPVQRDNSVGGLQIGETGTRNVTVSAGRLWSRVSDFNISSKNSSVDSMQSVYFNGVNLTVTSGITQWDNLNFNNLGTGSLQLMGNNKYANLWFFMSFNGDHYGFAYGTNEYNSLGDAANEGVPSYLTQNFFNQFILLGRFVFQKSATTANQIESAFDRLFTTQAVNTHNDLGGLQGGTTGEYYHLTSAQHAELSTLVTGGTTGQFWRGDGSWSNALMGSLSIQSGATSGALVLGADVNATTITNGVRKLFRATMPAFNSATVANQFIFGSDSNGLATTDAVYIGAWAGASGMTAACRVFFGTAAAPGTVGGTNRWLVENIGDFLPVITGTYNLGSASNRVLQVFTNQLSQAGARFETGVVSPAQITADTDNWAVTGITSSGIIRASTDASRNLTGIASPTSGQMIRLINVGGFDLVLMHDATSTAANRFLLPNSANLTLNPNDSVSLWYDNVSSRWRALGV